MALTARKKRFCEELMVDQVGSAAAIRAGFSPKRAKQYAYELLQEPQVQAYVQELREAQAKRCEIDADYVLGTIRDTMERCRQAEPVVDRKGNPVFVQTPDGGVAPAYAFDAQGVLRGAELLGKHLKLFTDKHEHSGPGGAPLAPPTIIVDFGEGDNA